jgi:hypothetical protein
MSGFDAAIRRARNDYLLVGRGQVWLRYNPLFGESISPPQKGDDDITNPSGEPEIGDDSRDDGAERELLAESIEVTYCHWQDYYTFPAYARIEPEIEGKGRKLYMSRSDMKEAGFKDWKKIPLTHNVGDEKPLKSSSTTPTQVTGKDGMQAVVYEIWWKPERRVYFVAEGWDKVVKEVDDPLKLEGFFPCPCPLTATMTNDTTIPVPDYAESQDQYDQIDDLSKRIDILTASCKIVGVYDASAQALKRVFEEASEPNLIPVDSWAMFAEKGGLKGAIDWVPVEAIAGTLKILIEVRQQIIADLDRTTGISDIMRGTSDARETMGAQRLKTNNSSTRLQERQDDVARFCRDIICIMGEIISEQYRPETLIQVSGALNDEGMDPPALPPNPMLGHNGGPPMGTVPQSPPGMMGQAASQQPGSNVVPFQPPGAPQPPSGPPPEEPPEMKQQRKLQLIMDAIGLLKQDKLRGFRIDIETDSTVQGDREQEKAQRTQFVSEVTKFVQVAAEVSQSVPEFAPLAAKMLQFAVRGFRVGRDLESAIEDFADKAEIDAKQKALQPPKPSPDEIKAQADMALAQHKIQSEGQQNQVEMMKAQAEVQAQQVEAESEKQNALLEQQRKQMEMEWEGRLKAMDMRMKEMDIHIAMIKAGVEEKKAGEDREAQEREVQFAREEHARKTELAQAEHHDKMAKAGKVPNDTANHVADAIGKISEHLKGLHDHVTAPVEVRRGPDGRAIGVRKGETERQLLRGPDGRLVGIQ